MNQTLAINVPTHPARPAASALAIAGRTLRKFMRTPQLVVVSTIQGAMFLVIFRYVFGGAISTGSAASYVAFLIPGFVVTGTLFSSMMAAVGMAEDLDGGFADRLRSLPVGRGSLMAGRALADTAVTVWGVVVSAAIGFAVGFRTSSSPPHLIAAFALLTAFAFAFAWLFITIGLAARTPQAANGYSLIVFPFTFVSSSYVPVASMPGWLQAFARNQPVTAMVDAVRSLSINAAGGVDTHAIVVSLLWTAAIVAVAGPLATWRFARG